MDKEYFLKELEGYYKRRGRSEHVIRMDLSEDAHVFDLMSDEKRDKYLEDHLELTLSYEARKKQKGVIPTEAFEQKAFVEWWRKTYRGHVVMMIRNDGSRTAKEKIDQVTLGVHPGVSDLYIPLLQCWLEMKRTKNWSWSEDQKRFKDYVEEIGDTYILGIGFEDAKKKVLALINKRHNDIVREALLEIIR